MSLKLLSKKDRGSSSVLVIMVLLMLVTFGVLALVTANSNLKISQKNALWNQSYYQLENKAVKKLKEILKDADNLIMESPSEWHVEMLALYDEIDFIDDSKIQISILDEDKRQFFIELDYNEVESGTNKKINYEIKQWREVPLMFEYEDELQFGDPGGN